jgi:hypothetical protein
VVKSKSSRFIYAGSSPRPRLVDVFADVCSQPSCDAAAYTHIATQTPLCEQHIYDVYRATNQLLVVENPKRDEYALLPAEQQQIPGPCPACGHAGYLMHTVTDQVRCLNAACYYEAHLTQFEAIRRNLMFELAGKRPVVYYIKFRDCVKIGTTRNLRKRWSGLTATEMLYGLEFGDQRLERRRHSKFAPYRTYGEWFEDNQHIRAHINEVCVTAA